MVLQSVCVCVCVCARACVCVRGDMAGVSVSHSKEALRCNAGCCQLDHSWMSSWLRRRLFRSQEQKGWQMLSINPTWSVNMSRSCGCCPLTASPCSHSIDQIKRLGSSRHTQLAEMMYDSNTQWGMAHLFWLICSSPIVRFCTYIHIHTVHTYFRDE